MENNASQFSSETSIPFVLKNSRELTSKNYSTNCNMFRKPYWNRSTLEFSVFEYHYDNFSQVHKNQDLSQLQKWLDKGLDPIAKAFSGRCFCLILGSGPKWRSNNFERTFWLPRILPKTNERIRRSRKNEFICSFFGEFEDTKSPFETMWPLVTIHSQTNS